MKAVLAVEKGVIPPTYGFTNPNPRSKSSEFASHIPSFLEIFLLKWPAVKWNEWNVRVNTEPIPWPAHLPIRRASVNSFGYGGTNAHIIIEAVDSVAPSYFQSKRRWYSVPKPLLAAVTREELCSNFVVDFDEGYRSGREVVGTEAPPKHATQSSGISGRTAPLHDIQESSFPDTKRQYFLLPFSAHDSETLKANIRKLAERSQKYDLLDLSFTLSGRRSLLAKRAFAVSKQSCLDIDLEEDSIIFGDAKGILQPRAAFVFTGMLQICFLCKGNNPYLQDHLNQGQGAQWPTMGSTLMDEFPSFMQTIRLLDSVLERLEDAPLWTLEGQQPITPLDHDLR